MDRSSQINGELTNLKIQPQPDFERYRRRQILLRESGNLASAQIPEPFPTTAIGPSVWTSDTIDLNSLTLELSAGDILEVETALGRFKGVRRFYILVGMFLVR